MCSCYRNKNAPDDGSCNLRLHSSWILPDWVNEMHCHVRHIHSLAPVLSGCVLRGCCLSQHSLMRAEKQQKQMELPVGLWEDSGRAGTAVVGGSQCHVVACRLCPLVISASPAWWSSRRSLACQLNMGPQSALKVHPNPRACLPSFLFFPSSFFISLQPTPCHAGCFVLACSLSSKIPFGCFPVFLFSQVASSISTI